MKRWLIGLAVAGVTGLTLTSTQTILGHADADLDNALKTAPQGVMLFDGDKNSGHNVFNTRKVKQKDNGKMDNDPNLFSPSKWVPSSIMMLTENGNQQQEGAIWSKEASSNRLNIYKNAHFSMWLHFGDKTVDKIGEGMAFVLQNGTGGNAPKDKQLSGSGESLGVWGVEGSNILDQAISHSWALEFDTHANRSAKYNALQAFDLDGDSIPELAGPHIASGYPGEADTYTTHTGGGYNHYTMTHNQPKSLTGFNDGQWHHVTLDWDAQSKMMSYQYDDVDTRTGQKQDESKIIQDKVKIDTSKLVSPASNGDVFWGMTGSNYGKSGNQTATNPDPDRSENGFVIIEDPDTLDRVVPEASLTDETTGKPIAEGETVISGHKIKYQYKFTYKQPVNKNEREQVIQPLTMNIPLPTQLKWTTSGSDVSYDWDAQSDPFSDSDLNGQAMLNKAWTQTLSKDHKTATVSIAGTVKDHNADSVVSGTTSRFYGTNYQTTLKQPSFKVQDAVKLKLAALGETNQTVKHRDDATVKASLTNDGTAFATTAEAAKYPITATLNGKDVTKDVAQAAIAGDLTPGHYQWTIPAELLTQSENHLSLKAAGGQDASASEAVDYVITREPGKVYFSALPDKPAFTSTQLTGNSQLVGREPNNWNLGVYDDRDENSQWLVTVSLLKPFHVGDDLSKTLDGNILFAQKGEQPAVLDENARVVMAHKMAAGDDVETNISGTWGATTGPTLNVGAGAAQGNYNGTFQWTLNNAPTGQEAPKSK
ncbi:L-type lectin family protein [Levilactobacillus tongjiangensis]|uniref:WxL domain-containing protein n=1 Tax=Levilactobacillus tongjiangensis TaxID=2486023 RepID=A0ABW1SR04_9LACO|nr:hypothetical protein [Levilactobacillus tongjiangensis]